MFYGLLIGNVSVTMAIFTKKRFNTLFQKWLSGRVSGANQKSAKSARRDHRAIQGLSQQGLMET